ncbi:MAG: GNAT family N-acetyltransferase [Oryzihumus sp.]
MTGATETAALSHLPVRTARLDLHVFTREDVTAMLEGRRLPRWVEGYPREDDVDVARHVASLPAPGPQDVPWLPRHIVVREIGLAVGSVGFFGPPGPDASVEIGYGLVEGARHQGYASEAVAGLVAAAQAAGIRLVVAHTLPDNVPSQAVLLRNRFLPTGRNEDGEPRFERRLP